MSGDPPQHGLRDVFSSLAAALAQPGGSVHRNDPSGLHSPDGDLNEYRIEREASP